MNGITIRKALLSDSKQIAEIYNYYVNNTAASFEVSAVSGSEMSARISAIIDSGLPYYVAENESGLAGFCYVSKWMQRAAYSATKEITVYLRKDQTGKGLGSSLYRHMLKQIDAADTHVLVAVIALPNPASIKLHEKFGFKQVSHMQEIGKKFGDWQDIGHWQLILSEQRRNI